ncbi:MAG TPA: trehalose-6-phosphate synthase [Terracidiphilus sp.]|nr:trehalose-6-phosphate synthase [Terracidiphilus sp.]
MRSFRIRLILALIVGITVVSLASTYFEVLTRKHVLRRELERRTGWIGNTLQPAIEQFLTTGATLEIAPYAERLRSQGEALGLAVYDAQGDLVKADGPAEVFRALPPGPVRQAIKKGENAAAYGHTGDIRWLDQAIPLHVNGQPAGALVVLEDAGYISAETSGVWQQMSWRILAFVVLIVGVTFVMVRWFLTRPLARLAERLRRLRMGHNDDQAAVNPGDLNLFTPLAREVANMAESLVEARAAAATEARLREAGENLWTAERLAVHVGEKLGSSRIFVVSNREPYVHTKRGRETVCVTPPSGLVTAIEPMLLACDGVWVAHGSGSEDATVVDEFDRLKVPPLDPRYTLRRVWLTPEEESSYYDGFANEGLWPLCHIAHTRPTFRASDWEAYQLVNRKFADALLQEMEGSANPIVFVQDYHFALLPRMVKAARPEARVAIFWHIPWPNPEAFGICPWQAELLEGLLGADLIGFHIPLHCNNFLDTVDRVLESRTDREHMTARRRGHTSTIRPYPVSVAIHSSSSDRPVFAVDRNDLLKEFGVRAQSLILGVDRLDYTKGIVERLMAFERLLEDRTWQRGRVTMVQIAAPSRTRIPSYIDLSRKVEEIVERINVRFQTANWRPVVLIERQCSHDEVTRWYRAADVCLVTSLHDGMNLVAKEYLAAREDEEGVLILSKFTGAAVELRDALIVNPYDIDGVADTLNRALEMGYGERRMRMQRLRRQVMEHNVYRWAANILGDLRELRLENAEMTLRPEPVLVHSAEGAHRKRA